MIKKTKICLNFMAGNEEHIIKDMLESCFQYIDYYIAQCNGSDRTAEIVDNFFKEKGIPGFSYYVEWQNPGYNSDHLIQTCLVSSHNCDWFLRVDADERLVVESDFDWSILEDNSIQSWNVIAKNDSHAWFRSRIWNTNLSWRFKHDKRHECIILPGSGPTNEEFQRVNLDSKFHHFITNNGKSYENKTKFLIDALELENQKIADNSLTSDLYHLFYIAKSYYDAFQVGEFPLGIDYRMEFARRAIFYFSVFEKLTLNQNYNEMLYVVRYFLGEAYCFCKEHEKAEEAFLRCELCEIPRNEHIAGLTHLYCDMKKYDKMLKQAFRLVDPNRKNPFPEFSFLINNTLYVDTGKRGRHIFEEAKKLFVG